MIHYTQRHLVKPGMRLKATGFNGNEHAVCEGQTYEVAQVVEGIFPDRPYVSVILPNGRKTSLWHLSRFSFIAEDSAA